MSKEKQAESKQLVIVSRLEEQGLEIPSVLKTEDEAFSATDLILKARKLSTEIDEKRKARTAPANETIRLINEDYKKFLEPLQNLEKKLRSLLEGYANERIANDLARLASLREETGDKSLIIPIGLKSIPSAAGDVRFRKGYGITVIDEKKVPKKYWTVDLKAIQKDVDVAEGLIKIPGVEITQTASAAIYTK